MASNICDRCGQYMKKRGETELAIGYYCSRCDLSFTYIKKVTKFGNGAKD